MNLKELRDAARVDLDDVGTNPLFQDAWLNRRFNQAVVEAARRARLLEDSETVNDGATTTFAITSITKSGTTATVTTTAPHGRTTADLVTHGGATGADASLYNVAAAVTVTGPSAYTYTLAGTPAVDATGTLTGTVSTPNPICVWSVKAGDRVIALDPRIILVKRVKLASLDLPTPRKHRADLDLLLPGWETSTQGDVLCYCSDFTRGKLYFVNPFPADDTVTLTVIREPVATLAADADAPEIAPRYHEGLLHWVRFHAHSRTDVEEVYDLKKAQEQLALFEQEFGKRSSAIDETWIEREQMYDGYDGTF